MKLKRFPLIMKLFLFYLLLLPIKTENIFSEKKQKSFKIYSNKIYESNINKNKIKKKTLRILSEEDDEEEQSPDYFIPLKIYLDLENFKDSFPFKIDGKLDEDKKDIFINAMEKAKNTLESLIEIDIFLQDILLTDNELKSYGLEKWDTNFFGGTGDSARVPNNSIIELGITNIFFFIFDSLEHDNLASSKIIRIDDQGTPSMGIITLNENFPSSKITPEFLEILMLHEFTHLLGFHQKVLLNSDPLEYFEGIIKEDVSGGHIRYYLDNDSSPKLFEYANKYFGCSEDSKKLTEINLEMNNLGNIHWPSGLLLGDYMTEFNYIEEQVISGFTLSFLEDLGYLRIKKYYTGSLMRFGKYQGCDFFNIPCINSNGIKFPNDFYYPSDNNFDSTEPSCSSGRLSRTVHILHNYVTGDNIPSEYRYFGEGNFYGGLPSTNYCPVSEYDSSGSNDLYINSCSKKGTISNDAKNKYGEAISDNSFCVLNNLVKKSEIGAEQSQEPFRAGCYNMFCSSKSLTIQVGEDFLVCPRGGGKIISNNYAGYILCPDYNLMCTIQDENESDEDVKLCNDLFDCVEKKVEEKKIYNYEYEIKTTQVSSSYSGNDVQIVEGMEQTQKGICPMYCSQCKKDTGCFKCHSDYDLFGRNENDENEKIICKAKAELETKHYKNPNTNIYYACADEKCITCQTKNFCTLCETHFKVIEGQCKEKVEHCKEYDVSNENICKYCEDNYGLLKEGEETQCILSSNLNNDYYYSEGEGNDKIYKKCSSGVENCLKCESSTYCTECINNNDDKQYAIVDDDFENCKDLKTKKYFKDSDNKYKSCNVGIINCETCEKDNFNILNCLACKTPFKLVHSDKDECIEEGELQNNYYFKDEEGNYASCTNSLYHSVENCLTCNNKNTCLSCQTGYQIVNSNDLCISNNDLKRNKYIKINNSYKACSEVMKGCEICTDEETCTTCDISFDLDINNKCIPTALALTKYYLDIETKRYKICSDSIDNCDECSSSTECTRCKSGYDLDEDSKCNKIEKEEGKKEDESHENNESNESKDNSNNGKDKDYDKIKALSIGGIVLGTIGTVVAIVAIIFMLLKNIFSTKGQSKMVSDATYSANVENAEPNEVVVQSTRRTIHNEPKNKENNNEE